MKRGDVFLATLDPVRGSEQAGTRPVIVIQSDPLSELLRTVIVIPFTTNLRWARFPFCVTVPQGEGGLAHDSIALCHQLRVLDGPRVTQRLGQVSETMLGRIDQALRVTLGM